MDDKERQKIERLAEDFANLQQAMAHIGQELERLLADRPSAKAVPDEAHARARRNVCLFCGKKIEGGRISRGLHQKCYSFVNRQIREKKVTEEELMSQGKMLPAQPGGRRSAVDGAKILAEMKEASRKKAKRKRTT